MSEPIPTPDAARARLPLTLGGVAAFARATFAQTFALALMLAALDALLVFGAFDLGWLPVIDDAVKALPDTGRIRARELQWTDESPRVLAGSPLLQIVVDVEGAGVFGDETDLRVELRRADFRLCGWFGCWTRPYPGGWIIALNQPELAPLWGAWRPFVLWGVFLGVIAFLLVSWGALAVLGAVPLRLAAYYADREMTIGGGWRMIVAALQPGGLFLGTAILFYGLRQLNVIELLVCFTAHFLLGVVWLVSSVRRLPRVTAPATGKTANPFAG